MFNNSGVLLDSDARKQKVLDIVSQIGRAGLNALYPHDFEYYMCSFELVNYEGVTVQTFIFPLMPKSIRQDEKKILNVEKSQGGINTTNVSTFEPIDISISGTFGRRFRILSQGFEEDFTAISNASNGISRDSNGKQSIKRFANSIRTGYGSFKELQSLFRKSNSLDDKGRPYRMYFYNPAIGDNFLVRLTSFSGDQDMSSNMVWNYDLKMIALAPAESIRGDVSRRKNLGKMLSASVVNQVAEDIVGDLESQLP